MSARTTPAAPVPPGPPGATVPSGSAVTSVFVRLKLSLLRNGLRQSGGRRAAYVARPSSCCSSPRSS